MYQVVLIVLVVIFLCALFTSTFALADSIREEGSTTRTLVTRGALWGTLMVLTCMTIFLLNTNS